MKIVVDSYAWIEIFSGSESGKVAMKHIESADRIITPDIVLSEVARKYIREKLSVAVVRDRLSIIRESSEIAGIDEVLAIQSAEAFLELSRESKRMHSSREPSLFDAIVLATARANDSKVLTGDLHFQKLPETIWIR